MEQVTSLQKRSSSSYKQIILELGSQGTAVNEAYTARCHFPLPSERGVAILCTGKHEQTRQSLLGSIRNIGGWPAQLLQVQIAKCCLNLFELCDAIHWPCNLDPATI